MNKKYMDIQYTLLTKFIENWFSSELQDLS